MENVHGKEISLQYVTVKVPGQKPRGSRSVNPADSSLASSSSNFLRPAAASSASEKKGEKVLLTGYELLKEPSGGEDPGQPEIAAPTTTTADTPNVKKRHRRIKSNGVKSNQDCDGERVRILNETSFVFELVLSLFRPRYV